MFVVVGGFVGGDCTGACERGFKFQRHLEARRQRVFHWLAVIDPSTSKTLLEGTDETIACLPVFLHDCLCFFARGHFRFSCAGSTTVQMNDIFFGYHHYL
jgi:hypothetical protein